MIWCGEIISVNLAISDMKMAILGEFLYIFSAFYILRQFDGAYHCPIDTIFLQ